MDSQHKLLLWLLPLSSVSCYGLSQTFDAPGNALVPAYVRFKRNGVAHHTNTHTHTHASPNHPHALPLPFRLRLPNVYLHATVSTALEDVELRAERAGCSGAECCSREAPSEAPCMRMCMCRHAHVHVQPRVSACACAGAMQRGTQGDAADTTTAY